MSTSTEVRDGYNTPIPSKIMTPDRVETRIGTLEFTDGFPATRSCGFGKVAVAGTLREQHAQHTATSTDSR